MFPIPVIVAALKIAGTGALYQVGGIAVSYAIPFMINSVQKLIENNNGSQNEESSEVSKKDPYLC